MADTTTKQTMAEANSSARGTARDVDAVERQMVDLIDPHLRDLFGEPIHIYSRERALADGNLVDAMVRTRELGFARPAAITRAAWKRCVAVPPGFEGIQDHSGRLHDVLWLARLAALRVNDNPLNRIFDLHPRASAKVAQGLRAPARFPEAHRRPWRPGRAGPDDPARRRGLRVGRRASEFSPQDDPLFSRLPARSRVGVVTAPRARQGSKQEPQGRDSCITRVTQAS